MTRATLCPELNLRWLAEGRSAGLLALARSVAEGSWRDVLTRSVRTDDVPTAERDEYAAELSKRKNSREWIRSYTRAHALN
jgi:hypothetical protein